MVHIKNALLGSTLCNVPSDNVTDWVSLEKVSFYRPSDLCSDCLFRFKLISGPKRPVREDSHFDTALARLTKSNIRLGIPPYSDIETEFPEWKPAEVNQFIKTVCGWD